MFITIENIQLHYKVMGSGQPVILLHGWGGNINYLAPLQEHLAQRFKVYAIDLPGCGLSSMPPEVWGSGDYANLIKLFIEKLQLSQPILLGHSWGGKIIIHLVTQHLVAAKKIVLIASSGILLPKSWQVKSKLYFFKLLKLLARVPGIKAMVSPKLAWYRQKFGSSDYHHARSVMRAILVKVVNENVIPLLSKITTPTLLLWGEHDQETPLQAGNMMQQALLTAHLKIISGSGHFPFLDNWERVRIELDNFLN